jgi:hypothetical protein
MVLSAAESVRGMECITTLQELMEKRIVNAIDFEELEATATGGYVMRKWLWLLEWWMYEKLREWWIDNWCVGFPKGGIEEGGVPTNWVITTLFGT